MDYRIIPAKAEHLNFLFETFLKVNRYDTEIGRNCTNTVFFSNYRKILDNILLQPDTQVLFAVLPEDDNVILGYCITQPHVLHFIFVKESFRRFGIAKALTASAYNGVLPKYYSHKSKYLTSFINKYPELSFNPFVLFKGITPPEESNGT